jgi:Gpi18-like mannosyltransferase
MVYALAIGCGITLLVILGATMFVAMRPLWREHRRELLIVAGLLGALAIVKYRLLPLFAGYPQDLFEFLLWGEVMTRNPAHIYDPQINCRYMPGYLYALWAAVAPARALYLGPAISDASTYVLRGLIRVPPIVADFLLGLMVYAWLSRLNFKRYRPGAVMLFALNPALNFTSVAWGQNDSVLTLPVMLALLMVAQGNYALAAAAAALALMVKLQALIVLPILGLLMLLRARVRDWAPAVLAFLATVVIAVAPFQIGRPWDFLAKVIESSADYFPYTSLNAFNLMALAVGMRLPDTATLLGFSAFHVGLFLLTALDGVVVCLLWRDRSPRAMLYAAFLAYLGFFVLPTRIHERYLYFALALLTPLALDSWATLVMYTTLTVTFLVNQIITLRFLNHLTTLPQHDTGADVIACVNLAALAMAIAYGLFLMSRDWPRWPRRLRSFFEPLCKEVEVPAQPLRKARVRLLRR